MRLHNLLSLPHLLVRCTRGNEPLIDYYRSHVVTSVEYLSILTKKTMDKVVAEENKEGKKKKIKNKQAKRILELGIVVDRPTIRILKNMLKHNLL
jgi:hypothetical protein